MLDHIVVKEERPPCADHEADDKDALEKATHVSNPIKEAINVSIKAIEREVELPCGLDVDSVPILVRSTHGLLYRENLLHVLSQSTELVMSVLQMQICHHYFVHLFFSNLRVDG